MLKLMDKTEITILRLNDFLIWTCVIIGIANSLTYQLLPITLRNQYGITYVVYGV